MLSLVCRSPMRRTLLISAIRCNSSVTPKTRSRFASQFSAGFTGVLIGAGAVVGAGAGGYLLYYFSGVRKTINRIQDALGYLDQARDKLSKRKPPSEVLWFLRQAVKSYVAFPGSNFVVDQVFNAVDDKVDAHADEANALIATACNQIRDLIQQDGKQHAVQILGILRDLTKQLQPNSMELKQQMAEKFEVGKNKVKDGLTAATAVTKAKIQDSKLFDHLHVENPFRRKTNNNNDPSSLPAADTTPLKSDDDRKL